MKWNWKTSINYTCWASLLLVFITTNWQVTLALWAFQCVTWILWLTWVNKYRPAEAEALVQELVDEQQRRKK